MHEHPDIFGDAADRAVFERHPIDDLEPLPESAWRDAAEAFSRILRWAKLEPRSGKTKFYVKGVTLTARIAIAAWAIRPDLWGISLTELAKQIGVSKQCASKTLRVFRSHMDFETIAGRTLAARENMRRAMLESHRRRKEKPPPGEGEPSGGCDETPNVNHVQTSP